jgi:hypothetical protein
VFVRDSGRERTRVTRREREQMKKRRTKKGTRRGRNKDGGNKI